MAINRHADLAFALADAGGCVAFGAATAAGLLTEEDVLGMDAAGEPLLHRRTLLLVLPGALPGLSRDSTVTYTDPATATPRRYRVRDIHVTATGSLLELTVVAAP